MQPLNCGERLPAAAPGRCRGHDRSDAAAHLVFTTLLRCCAITPVAFPGLCWGLLTLLVLSILAGAFISFGAICHHGKRPKASWSPGCSAQQTMPPVCLTALCASRV